MRVDKYLWAIRAFKTRTLAATSCKNGKVSIDDDTVKPSREVKQHDVISVRKGAITFCYKVVDIPKNRVGAKLVPDYAIDCTPQEELDKMEMIKEAQKQFRWKGLGRPTKKDRRDIDKFLE